MPLVGSWFAGTVGGELVCWDCGWGVGLLGQWAESWFAGTVGWELVCWGNGWKALLLGGWVGEPNCLASWHHILTEATGAILG